jgi:molybdopterin synthase sulfur carrier subunit
MIRLLFFGRLRDAAGAAELEIALPPDLATVADICWWLATSDPLLGAALSEPGTRFAVDQQFTNALAPVTHAREIAFMSPLSGG